MSKAKIFKELTQTHEDGAPGNLLGLAELDGDDWLDDEELLTVHDKAVLEARLAAYANDPDAGGTWEEVENRIGAALREPNRGPGF